MEPNVRRAVAFAVVAALALSAPVIGALAAVPFALIAVIGRTVSEGQVLELFSRRRDRLTEELRDLVGFALAATALALLAALGGLPVPAFMAAVLVLGFGNLTEQLACGPADAPIRRAGAFIAGGAVAATVGPWAAYFVAGDQPPAVAFVLLLAVVGALTGALLRAVLVERDDPVVLVTVGVALWVLARVGTEATPADLGAAVAVAGAFGYLSWLLGTASVTGMLTGVIISLVTIVLAGFGWFAVLLAFFGLGGLAAKFRYDEKRAAGVAEANLGARGGRNVLGNAAVALVAVIGYAASGDIGIDRALFLFAFAGSLSTAMSDTLSSEIGVLFRQPRLITTLEAVDPGTDGAVSVEGSLAGIAGAFVVAAIAALTLGVGPLGGLVIVVSGVAGMFADSVLGAAIEGRWIGNQAVNFLATLVGGITGATAAVGVGVVGP